jgi:squalene-hopene/tetraprenyl-beta-curcumene cyclase
MSVDPAAFVETQHNIRQRLLDERVPAGHWRGELSSSALSTATAAFALAQVRRNAPAPTDAARIDALVRGGLAWLRRTQNDDGGWGDTVRSFSNISTTALCWAALSLDETPGDAVCGRAAAWLEKAAGGRRSPETLATAITARYGKDRTFSVPILTMCALAGRLGPPETAWALIPALPFELAAFPRAWFRWLQLPVVSYALPALIAMGQARFARGPSSGPLMRGIRQVSRGRTLRVLREIQPSNGGFLEAAPLTSFVAMSLCAAGAAEHPVVRKAAAFLEASVRPDGSWPIDTDLATWLTTLSVNALLGPGEDAPPELGAERIVAWLLGQQFREVHPYTLAPPGGWSWTDLPGAVPDADDTAGALLALSRLAPGDPRVRAAAAGGVRWLLDLQNADGGIPTFCRGWGALPFDRSSPDLTAHALLAWSAWRDFLPESLQRRVDGAERRALIYLQRTQRSTGGWTPLWFGNQHAPSEENPLYGTARVLPALSVCDTGRFPAITGVWGAGMDWILTSQNPDGGWGGGPDARSSVEETGLALHALATPPPEGANTPSERVIESRRRGHAWLVENTDHGRHFEPSPIGFYFAKLWYFERLYPMIFAAYAQPRDEAQKTSDELAH